MLRLNRCVAELRIDEPLFSEVDEYLDQNEQDESSNESDENDDGMPPEESFSSGSELDSAIFIRVHVPVIDISDEEDEAEIEEPAAEAVVAFNRVQPAIEISNVSEEDEEEEKENVIFVYDTDHDDEYDGDDENNVANQDEVENEDDSDDKDSADSILPPTRKRKRKQHEEERLVSKSQTIHRGNRWKGRKRPRSAKDKDADQKDDQNLKVKIRIVRVFSLPE